MKNIYINNDLNMFQYQLQEYEIKNIGFYLKI